jgi:hypothetical protein
MSDIKKQGDSERALARLLAEALRPPEGAAGDSDCPDAGLLAAYADHNLDATETARWEEHFAGCARCQKILAVLTASGEEPLSEAELESFGRKLAAAEVGAPASQPRTVESKKIAPFVRPRTKWRWLAPAAGIAAAAALWIALRPAPPHGLDAINAQKTVAQPSAAPDESLEAKADVPAPPAATRRQTGPESLETQQLKSPAPIQLQEKKIEEAGGAAAVSQSSASQADDAVAAQGAGSFQGPAATASAANAPEARSREASPAAAAVTPPPAPPPAGAPAPAAPAAAAANRAPEAKPNEDRRLQAFASRGAIVGLASRAPAVVASPNRSVLWRLGPGGRIERSTDQGRSWQERSSGVTSDLLAGAAPSGTVAWIAGRAGAILRTTDGEHWQHVTSPDAATDWTAISAIDGLHATVASADRRRFATEDGGQTWKQQ